MATIVHDPTDAIAARLKVERGSRGWSLADLAERASVSKAMISKVERGESSPTATILGKLSGALGLPLSAFLARAETSGNRLTRAGEQPTWKDPDSGYTRRSLSPRAGDPLELIHVQLPRHARVSFPASAFTFLHQQIWMISGELEFHEGETKHRLRAGDCLQLGAPADCTFVNPTGKACRYLVALIRR